MSDHFNKDLLKQFGGVRVNSLNHVLHNEVETRTSENASLIQFDIRNILILKILKQIVKKID